MRQVELIHRQVELVAVSIGSRVRRLHDALDGLAFFTKHLFATTRPSPEEVARWREAQGFEVLDSGFYENRARIERARTEGPIPNETMYCWGPEARDHAESARRLYALRGLKGHLASLHGRLKGVAWIYYQDAETHHACMIFPGLAPDSMIPADFDWHEYHSFTIVRPDHDPEREIRWSPPNVDYAGQGLISCVSVPLWEGDRFLGVWTMDVRLSELHADLATDALGAHGQRQVNFLVDLDGRLIVHPSLDPESQGEKGAVYNIHVSSLGGDYEKLDVAALARQGHGQVELVDARGERYVAAFRLVPEIRWLVFAAFPAADLVEATQSAFQKAFAHLGAGDLSFRLDAVGDETMQRLVSSYNEMTEALQESMRRREQAEAERRRLSMEQERLARELEIAAAIQMSMLPRSPRHHDFEFAGLMRPADEVGGDFYDVITRPDGRLWLTVGDVSSHGLGAGLVMMIAQSAFRAVFESGGDPDVAAVIRHVNRLVHANATTRLGGGRYLTGQLLLYRGDGVFECAGGHLWPLVIDPAKREVRRVEAPGPWLGIVPELPAVPVTRIALAPGEVLCLYSDGIVEARNEGDEMFDLERLTARLVASLAEGRSLAECAADLHADVDAFARERDDDRTVLLARRAADPS